MAEEFDFSLASEAKDTKEDTYDFGLRSEEVKPVDDYDFSLRSSDNKVEPMVVPDNVQKDAGILRKMLEDQSNPSLKADWDVNYMPRNKDAIVDGMSAIYGVQVEDWDDEKLFDSFMWYNRSYDVANLARIAHHEYVLSKSDVRGKEKIGEMLRVWQEMPGGNKPKDELKQAWKHYATAVVLDPINVVAPGVGKILGWGGGKMASGAVTSARLKALKPGAARTFKEAEEIYAASMAEATKRANADLAKRTATTQSTSTTGKLWTEEAKREYKATIAAEMAFSAGAEYLYQRGYMEVGQQDQIYLDRVAITALGSGLVLSGAMAMNMGRGASGFKPTTNLPKPTQDRKKIFSNLATLMNDAKEGSSWAEKVAAGTEIEDLDFEFWRSMTSRMVASLADDGIVPPKDYPENFGNWLADMVKEGDPVDGRELLKEFSDATGIKIGALEGEDSLEVFANMFAKHYSMAGASLGDLGRAAQKLGDNAPLRDIMAEATRQSSGEMYGLLGKLSEKGTKFGGKTGKFLADSQTNIIRGIISNIGTTRLNIFGFGASTTENSTVDLVKGLLLLPADAIKYFTGSGDVKQGLTLIDMQRQKLRNTLDAGTNYDQYQALLALKGDELGEMAYTLSGGVDNLDEILKARGLDPDDSYANAAVTRLADVASYINLVQAQDAITKSIEFNYQLDKNLRLSTGKTLAEIMQHPQAAKLINQPEFNDAQAKALYETGRAIYSTSYRDLPIIGGLAGTIEDFRKIPFLGLEVPFGKFFNNVVAKTVDYSGVSVPMKALSQTFGKGTVYANRDYADLTIRAVLGWTVAGEMLDKANEYIDKGYGTYEYDDPITGNVVDGKWSYPASAYLAVSRIAAWKGREIPADEFAEIHGQLKAVKAFQDFWFGKGEIPRTVLEQGLEFVVGNLTRDLNDTTTMLVDQALGIMQEPEGAGQAMWELAYNGPRSNIIQGATRWLEPANTVLQMITRTPVMDVRDGDRKWNEATKYVSYWASDSNVPSFNVGEGKVGINTTKFMGDRAAPPMTYVSRVGNMVGEELWRLNKFSDSAAANNMYEQYFNSVLEEGSKKLWESDKFQNAPLLVQENMWSKTKSKAVDMANSMMATKSNESARLKLILDINAKPDRLFNAVIKEMLDPEGTLGLLDKRLDEMTEQQLIHIDEGMKWYFKNYDNNN